MAHVREDALRHHVETAKPTPSLAVLLVGHNPASEVYVRNKRMACARVGINFYLVRMNDSVRQEELIHEIHRLNEVSSRPMINIIFFLVVFFFRSYRVRYYLTFSATSVEYYNLSEFPGNPI